VSRITFFNSFVRPADIREQFAIALAAPFRFDVNLDNLRLRNGCERIGRFLLHSGPAPIERHGSDHTATGDLGQSSKDCPFGGARASTVRRRSFSVRVFPLLGKTSKVTTAERDEHLRVAAAPRINGFGRLRLARIAMQS
jgi:hypothetical protein